MHIHKIEFDYGNFGFGIGWHCVKCGKVYRNKPKLIILIKMFKKLKNLFHKHKFPILPVIRYYSRRGIECRVGWNNGDVREVTEARVDEYQETGRKIIRTCKCGLTIEDKIIEYDR